MESQPQNPEFRINAENVHHAYLQSPSLLQLLPSITPGLTSETL